MKPILTAILATLVLAGPAAAQTFPSRSETPITDDADMIPAVEEAQIAERLIAARQDTGAEIVVVTLISSALYTGGEEIGDYARLLAENWELGSTTDGKAAMLLVIRDDRDVYLRLESAYADRQETVNEIVTETIVPAFGRDEFVEGISAGVDAVVTRIAATAPPATTTPAQASDETASDDGGGSGLWWLIGLIGVPILAVIGISRRNAAKLAATPCPSCGKTGLIRERKILEEATTTREGKGETRTTCPSCQHSTAEPFTIAKKETKAKSDDKKDGTGAGGSW